MVRFQATILKFAKKGEKTGWSYIEVSSKIANQLKPGSKVSFRVKGKLDQYPISKTALIPMGDGMFILPINAKIRKATGKERGDKLKVEFELDKKPLTLSSDLMTCLEAEPAALKQFESLPMSHRNYFSKWIEGAKTIQTKTKRITMTVIAMVEKQTYGEMLRAHRDKA